ncbi:hypothetical protein AGMMS49992_16300 [Clostridia bacterium]|nr:hypothetical protein AGMMS49992_16300 [Clostridia bacterium]
MEDLAPLRGSKYSRSALGTVYADAKAYLMRGKPVYFSGTPCQIAGLKSRIGADHMLLITQDVVCAGMPTDAAYEAYLKYLEKKLDAKPVRLDFRDKSGGWSRYYVHAVGANGREYKRVFWDDPYMLCFINQLSLRDACYTCAFQGERSKADITLGDFWAVDTIYPEMNDNKGISLVTVRTEQGRALLETVRDRMKACVLPDRHLSYEKPRESSLVTDARERFLRDIGKTPLDRLVKQCMKTRRLDRLASLLMDAYQNIISERCGV